MHCPTLAELPPPLAGKTGWPWTVETPPLPPARPDGSPWPRISIVTPSYNQGQFIEETIRSILLQGYPDLEYIIIDGGSTDQSVDIIKKYEPWLAYWVSEKDRGQAHAINKGLSLCKGRIFNWVNSDDYLAQEALQVIANHFCPGTDVVSGSVLNFGDVEAELVHNLRLTSEHLITWRCSWHQPGNWLLADHARKLGGVPETFRFMFDWYFMIQYLALHDAVVFVDRVFVHFRLHPLSKSIALRQFFDEEQDLALNLLAENAPAPHLKKLCTRTLDRRQWGSMLGRLIRDHSLSRGEKAIQIAKGVWRHPSTRVTRMTAGALRNILIRRETARSQPKAPKFR